MDELPLDMSHPAVRNYLSLIRLQVLTPLSLLINIAVVTVCSLVVSVGIGDIAKMHPSSISPNPAVIGLYLLAIYIGQVGYCLLLVFASKRETKDTITKGSGLALVFANWAMAFWAIAWTLQWFLVSTVFLGILTLILLYANVVLLVYHPPTIKHRPLDTAFIHAPIRLFLILPMSLLFPYSLFIQLGLTWSLNHPSDSSYGQWAGFGVLLGVNLLAMLVIAIRGDIVWCVGAVWICVSVWSAKPKPASVMVTTILFTTVLPLTLITSILWGIFSKRKREGRIRLEEGDDEQDLHSEPHNQNHGDIEREIRPPREVDTNALWG